MHLQNGPIGGRCDYPKPGYMTYPAAVLMVTDESYQTFELKQKLEDQGCQVYLADTYAAGLMIAGQKYVDLIVINTGEPDGDNLKMYQKLKVAPELSSIPLVVLTTCDQAKGAAQGLNPGTIYYLTKDEFNEAVLMSIIDRTLYMTYRYLPLCIS